MTDTGPIPPPGSTPPPSGPATPPPGAPLNYSTAPADAIIYNPAVVPGQIITDPNARTWGMLCHLAAFVGLLGIPFGHVLGPLVVWLIKKNEIPFVDDQGKESLNFQITVAIAALICSPLICLAGVGLILVVAVIIAGVVFAIIAGIKANQGIVYRYPWALRLIK